MKDTPKYECEQALLGGIMLDCNAGLYACVQNGITENSFFDARNKKVWNAMQQLARNRKVVDSLTVGKIIGSGWDKLLEAMIDKCITIAHVDYYAQEVRSNQKQHQFLIAIDRAKSQLSSGGDFAGALEFLQQEMIGLSVDNRITIKKIKDYKDEKIEQWDRAKGMGYVGIPFVLPRINEVLGGMRKKMVSVIGGFRNLGKSTLARQAAIWQAEQGYKVALFTPEDTGDIASAGMVGNKADLSVFSLDTGHGTSETILRMSEKWDEVGDLPLYIIPDHLTIGQITSTATMIKARYGLDILYYDHIQLINPLQLPHMNRTTTLSVYSSQLASLAKQLDIHICELSQLSRDSEKKDRRPKMSDLRESGSIEQDARQVLLLSQDKDTKLHTLEVAKNNNGISGVDIIIRRMDGKQRFEEVESD